MPSLQTLLAHFLWPNHWPEPAVCKTVQKKRDGRSHEKCIRVPTFGSLHDFSGPQNREPLSGRFSFHFQNAYHWRLAMLAKGLGCKVRPGQGKSPSDYRRSQK